MGKRGPQKTPDAIKIARGTLRSRDGDPALRPQSPPAVLMEPPAELKDEGRRVWETVGPQLVDAGVLTELDRIPFTRYCRAHDEIERLDKVLEEQGEYFATEGGYVGQHPAVNQRFKWLAELNRFEARFGMNASDRCGIQVKKESGPAVRARARG